MSDEYPTEDELARVRDWPIASSADLRAWFDFIKSLWWAANWGWHEEQGEDILERPVVVIHMSTGGWSGNEEIIGAMEENSCGWVMSWQMTRRGGHYTFHVEP